MKAVQDSGHIDKKELCGARKVQEIRGYGEIKRHEEKAMTAEDSKE